jgi:acetyltransferase
MLPRTDKAHDVLHQGSHPLDAIFKPKNVAVIGATETAGSVGRTVLWNLISTPFGGTVFPVNPKRPSVLGIKAYASLKDIPAPVDLIVVCTPAPSVPQIIRDAVAVGVKGAVVISAGFAELGEEGKKLLAEMLSEARKGKMRIIGPNCLGILNPVHGVNASFANGMVKAGSLAFLSQSGALGTAVLDWSFREQVGFSGFVSIGSMADVDWGDLIDYYGNDPRTSAIVVYMESIGNARSFLSAAREVSLNKPIIVIKAGRTAAAAKAAASHTGSMTGSDDVLDAAFRRVGVLRVNSIDEVFAMSEVLAKQPRPKGPRLTILTNAGGPGVLATDALVLNGGELNEISEPTMKALNGFLPIHWSHNNPVDVLGDAKADRYAKALEICAHDPNADGLMVILTPQDMTDATGTAEALKPYAQIEGKPVLASWMGGPFVKAGAEILVKAGIPNFEFPDTAAKAFCYMWKYAYNLKALYETPTAFAEDQDIDREGAKKLIDEVRASGREIMTEYEAKKLMSLYGIPTVPTEIATTEADAVAGAAKIGFPVVLKLHSFTITHKTDVGGVKLNLKDEAAVRQAFNEIKTSVANHPKWGASHFQGVTVQPFAKFEGYEVIIGSTQDSQFGPVMLFGSGGQLVEVYKDSALALPPLNATLARRMMEQTKIYTALKGVRGRKSVDLQGMEKLLVRFSQLISEQSWIKEVDINPLLASPEKLIALDARVVLFAKDTPEEKLPKLAIRPYPTQYISKTKIKSGQEVVIRPIRPEDEPALTKFHELLSERTVKLRYFAPMKLTARVAHERLVRVCHNDFDREMALVAEMYDAKTKEYSVMGVGRLSKTPGVPQAEFAVLISDLWQNQGLGTELLRKLIEVGKAEKLESISAEMMSENSEMQKVCRKLGFKMDTGKDVNDPVHAEMKL